MSFKCYKVVDENNTIRIITATSYKKANGYFEFWYTSQMATTDTLGIYITNIFSKSKIYKIASDQNISIVEISAIEYKQLFKAIQKVQKARQKLINKLYA